jgi:hypothetical protein
MVTYRLWKRARTHPLESRLQATLRGCENDRLQVNHTLRMPAKVGPKRVPALARAGCYFDSSAARCGAELFDLRRERRRRSCNHARACRHSVRCGLSIHSIVAPLSPPSLRIHRRHCEPTGRREAPPDDRLREAIHSFLVPRHGLLRFSRNDGGDSFAISRRNPPEVCNFVCPSELRAQGRPGACCTRSRVRFAQNKVDSIWRSRRSIQLAQRRFNAACGHER